MGKKFSLKDYLFNETKITKLAQEIYHIYPKFDKNQFIKNTLAEFPSLELKERIRWISKNLKDFLPDDYQKATTILIDALPPPMDPTKTDNDFGEFIYAPYADFVAKYGCNKKDLHFSLQALKEITTRFSAEDAIRYFINAFPKETLQELLKWSTDSHYHVRRLASEGTRPKLPWTQNITIPPEEALPILENLYTDKTRYVTRSVANHINDISKMNPALVFTIIKRWQKSGKQNQKEMDYIIHHALRTLIKKGNKEAIEFLQMSSDPQISLSNFQIINNTVIIGKTLEFTFDLTAEKEEQLIIDYVLYFQNKAGKGSNKKVFKIKKITLQKKQKITINKKHPMRKNMTTRKLYPGKHTIAIQINGKIFNEQTFDLV